MVRSEKTRQLIIEKTASIFNKKGYTGTYLSDLTQATGLTKGSIYGNFKDKNEVAVEAFKYNLQFQSKQLSEKLDQEDRAQDKLLAFLNYYRTAFRSIFNNGGCAILNTAIDADDGNEALKNEVVKTIYSWHQRIVTILEEGRRQKEWEEVNSSVFSYRIIAMVEGSIMLAKTLDKPEILIDNIDFLEAEIHRIIKN
ncbi:TetR/AcrR family transcriptional regulator [bacterium SCSIO 12741]|nr:TetR/AcrR family transcriptional regulator [bacterium SCSIO 12741]